MNISNAKNVRTKYINKILFLLKNNLYNVQFTMKHTHIHSNKVENLIQNLHIPRRKAKNKLDGHISAGGNHLEEQ